MHKYKKQNIPKSLRNQVWVTNCGENFNSQCFCCKNKITVYQWECGHIISEFEGGKLTIDNLKPICSTCNKSMGTQNMYDFKKSFYSEKKCTIC